MVAQERRWRTSKNTSTRNWASDAPMGKCSRPRGSSPRAAWSSLKPHNASMGPLLAKAIDNRMERCVRRRCHELVRGVDNIDAAIGIASPHSDRSGGTLRRDIPECYGAVHDLLQPPQPIAQVQSLVAEDRHRVPNCLGTFDVCFRVQSGHTSVGHISLKPPSRADQ